MVCQAPNAFHKEGDIRVNHPMLVGDTFPSARVIGVDLSRIQPVWLPPNVEFFVDDIEDEWMQPSDLDYVHLRVVCATLKDPRRVLAKAFR